MLDTILGMNCLEAMIEAENLRKTSTVPIQKYREGDEINGLVVLGAVFNRVSWMWSYMVSQRGGRRMTELMEWSL